MITTRSKGPSRLWRLGTVAGAVLMLVGLTAVADASPPGRSDASDQAVAAAAEAAYTCNGKTATIVGTSGNDLLVGTSGDDVIVGLGGNDKIFGRSGNDMLCGNSGWDKIYPGKGIDYVNGGRGSRDWVGYASAKRGVVVSLAKGVGAGQGRDTLVSVENIVGSKFDDKLIGNSRDNRIVAGSGADRVWGMAGDDILYGGAGFDMTNGGGGTDTCASNAELRLYCDRGHRTISSGIWIVPGEVGPLIYRNSTSQNACYWARLSGFGGGLDDIIANQLTFEIDIVEVSAADAGFESSRCGTWSTDLTPRTSSPRADFAGGAFLVGYEVGPGLWRNSDSADGCYWERRSGFGGTLGDIIANGFSFDIQTVSIARTDLGFTSEGCGTWTRIG